MYLLVMLNLNTQSLYIPFTTFKKLEDRFNVYNHLAWNENVQYKSS